MMSLPFQTTRLNAVLAVVVVAVLAGLGGGGMGYWLGHRTAKAAGDAAVAKLERDRAATEKRAADAALGRLREAQVRGDTLARSLAAAEAARKTQEQEHAREIQRLTTGRLCLNAGTVRLLNQPAGAINAARLPASAGRTAAEDAAAASDTDVAGWISGAKRQYGECSDRLDALIDWNEGAADADH